MSPDGVYHNFFYESRLDPSRLFLFGPTPLLFLSPMADDAQDNAEAAARKRARISDTDPGRGDDTPGDASDDDDDDIGPMPVPEGTGGDGAVRKKRKGGRRAVLFCPRWF